MFVLRLLSPQRFLQGTRKAAEAGGCRRPCPGPGLRAGKGSAEADHNRAEEGTLAFWAGSGALGGSPFPPLRSLRAHEWSRDGRRQAAWERRALGGRAPSVPPGPTGHPVRPAFSKQMPQLISTLPSARSLSRVSTLHLTPLQTGGSMGDPAGSIPDLSEKHHLLRK